MHISETKVPRCRKQFVEYEHIARFCIAKIVGIKIAVIRNKCL